MEVSSFCNEFIYYDHCFFCKSIWIKPCCKIKILSEIVFRSDDDCILVLGVVDDITLMVINRKVEHIVPEIIILRVGILQLLFLEKLYKKEAGKEDRDDITINGKTLIALM